MDRALVTQAISKASHRGEIKTQALNKRQKNEAPRRSRIQYIYIVRMNSRDKTPINIMKLL